MKDRIKRWLGITAIEHENIMLWDALSKLDRRVGRLHSKPLRHDQVERARKQRKKTLISTIRSQAE